MTAENPTLNVIGSSASMKAVAETIKRVAETGVDVLILGETGTGKELVARSVHDLGRRADGPFVPIDCGAIPENLLESALFGYEGGAFTGADRQRRGLLETASGGTFFLDEIGDLPLLLQAKLLRVLQERKLRRVGGNAEVDVDVQIVAATSLDLDQMVQDRTFREDLYYRINVVRIDLPPLRERGDDLGLLAEHFVLRCSREMERRVPAITPAAYSGMRRYHWPGNIRELQNIIRRAITLSGDDQISQVTIRLVPTICRCHWSLRPVRPMEAPAAVTLRFAMSTLPVSNENTLRACCGVMKATSKNQLEKLSFLEAHYTASSRITQSPLRSFGDNRNCCAVPTA